ncbi:nudix domain containing protein [Niveomyces insectorum RCEF 264]|uniref:Nudix domain containing protein n=1 Tax=Niveomyces insectorum RCEF 264 TaxID=1081102 RepID=A0A167MTT5_9HYPO|nr:nudix domain containing protein [Niveomyces insectorum RCEF 264]
MTTTSSAGCNAVANDRSTDETLSTAASVDAPLAPEDVDNLAASIHSFGGTSSDGDNDSDTDDNVPRASIGDDSYYWDPATMAPLSARSAAAIARLRAFRPPSFPLWDRLPLSRRAAVLVLLYADRRGELRVVLTMRAASLRNYSGHAAFPGGKADTLNETPEQIARREAWEEIGLPLDDGRLPRAFRIEHLCSLPYNLAKTELVVRPCIALLHAGGDDRGGVSRNSNNSCSSGSGSSRSSDDAEAQETDAHADETLIPRLDAKEVAAVFSAPFHNFLLATDEVSPADGTPLALTNHPNQTAPAGAEPDAASTPPQRQQQQQQKQRRRPRLPPGPWYEGSWIHWHEAPWRMHFFYVPVVGQRVAKPRKRIRSESATPSRAVNGDGSSHDTPAKEDEQKDEDEGKDQDSKKNDDNDNDNDDEAVEAAPGRYKVWGMTARILVDAAQLAYGETPAFEHNAHFGDERIIEGLAKMGRLGDKKAAGSELTHEDLKEASKM